MAKTFVVKYGNKMIPVADGLTRPQIKQLMQQHFAELSNPRIDASDPNSDGVVTLTFAKQAAKKG